MLQPGTNSEDVGLWLSPVWPLEPKLSPRRPIIRLDPRDDRIEWIDDRFRVAWNVTPEELAAVAGH